MKGDGLVPSRLDFMQGLGAGDHKGRPYMGMRRVRMLVRQSRSGDSQSAVA